MGYATSNTMHILNLWVNVMSCESAPICVEFANFFWWRNYFHGYLNLNRPSRPSPTHLISRWYAVTRGTGSQTWKTISTPAVSITTHVYVYYAKAAIQRQLIKVILDRAEQRLNVSVCWNLLLFLVGVEFQHTICALSCTHCKVRKWLRHVAL